MTHEGPDQGQGQGQAGDDGGRDVTQEQEDHQHHQGDGQHQGELDVLHRLPDRLRTGRRGRDRVTAAGSLARKAGNRPFTASTTATVLVPGWRWTARTMARVSLSQPATLSFCTLSMTRPSSSSRTGRPFR